MRSLKTFHISPVIKAVEERNKVFKSKHNKDVVVAVDGDLWQNILLSCMIDKEPKMAKKVTVTPVCDSSISQMALNNALY